MVWCFCILNVKIGRFHQLSISRAHISIQIDPKELGILCKQFIFLFYENPVRLQAASCHRAKQKESDKQQYNTWMHPKTGISLSFIHNAKQRLRIETPVANDTLHKRIGF